MSDTDPQWGRAEVHAFERTAQRWYYPDTDSRVYVTVEQRAYDGEAYWYLFDRDVGRGHKMTMQRTGGGGRVDAAKR